VTDKDLETLKKQAWGFFNKKDYRNAAKCYIAALRAEPEQPQFCNMIAICLRFMGKPSFAIKMLEKAIEIAPTDAALYNNLGTMYTNKNDIDNAFIVFKKAFELSPELISAGCNLAKIYHHKKQFEKAIEVANHVLSIEENNRIALFIKAYSLIALEIYAESYQILKPFYNNKVNNVKLLYHLGVAAFNLNKFNEAILLFEKCVKLSPKNANYWNYLAVSLKKLKHRRLLAEVNCLRQAIKLSPETTVYYHNLANTFISANKLKMAEKIITAVLEKEPTFVEALISYGFILQLLRKNQQAKTIYQKALELNSNATGAHTNLGILQLLEGDFENGWTEYEYRWQHPDLQGLKKNFTDTKWEGQTLEGKTLMIFTEQGYGDTIQFVRYLPLINKGSGKIIIECRASLVDLIKTLDNVDMVISRGEPLPSHDYYMPLLSLPHLFKTTEKTIPHHVPYLKVDSDKNKYWKETFNKLEDTFKIGIAWAGNFSHKLNHYRTIKPFHFEQLKIDSRIRLYSLQIDSSHDICKKHGFIDLSDHITDFTDTAAIINNLDLIVSVDTSIVHLAGALNLPVWNIIGFISDWRWLLDRTDSPWYPSMRLFRQQSLNRWQPVFDDITAELKKLIQEK